jgi:hypothetical protein
MMHGHEKSDLAIVATKPANKAERSAAEPVERRAGAKGNAGQQGTHRTQNRASVSQALERIRRAVGNRARDITLTVTHLRWEPYALIGHVRICAGGAQQWASLPRQRESGMRAGTALRSVARGSSPLLRLSRGQPQAAGAQPYIPSPAKPHSVPRAAWLTTRKVWV